MHDLEELNEALSFVENEKNYFSKFRHVIETCINANAFVIELWNVSKISDVELHNYKQRINIAKQTAIKTHKNWVLKRLLQNDRHTMESIVESIYNDLFD